MRGYSRPIASMSGQELSGLLSSTRIIENRSVIFSSAVTSRSHNSRSMDLPM